MAEEFEVTVDGKKIKYKLPMIGVRRIIANNLQSSWDNSVPISGFFKYDCSAIRDLKNKLKAKGLIVSYTEIFIILTASAVKASPIVNSSIVEKKIEIYDSINVGVAVSAPDGSLIVPVIREVQDMDIRQVAESLSAIKQKMQNGTIVPADMIGGTITISSMGMFDTYGFTQVLSPGQSFILGFGSIHEEAVVLEDGTIAVRPMIHMSATADHRVIHGVAGAEFMKALGDGFANPEKYISINIEGKN